MLCGARVERVMLHPVTNAAAGVRVRGGATIEAPVVVSAAGFFTTFEKLLRFDPADAADAAEAMSSTDTDGDVSRAVAEADVTETRSDCADSAAGYAVAAAAAADVKDMVDLVKRKHLRQSHGHVCAYVSMDAPPDELGLRAANIHSFPDQLRAPEDAGGQGLSVSSTMSISHTHEI